MVEVTKQKKVGLLYNYYSTVIHHFLYLKYKLYIYIQTNIQYKKNTNYNNFINVLP